MNDDHGNDFLRTQFMVDHPDARLGTEPYRGKGALDFGRVEVHKPSSKSSEHEWVTRLVSLRRSLAKRSG